MFKKISTGFLTLSIMMQAAEQHFLPLHKSVSQNLTGLVEEITCGQDEFDFYLLGSVLYQILRYRYELLKN